MTTGHTENPQSPELERLEAMHTTLRFILFVLSLILGTLLATKH